MLAAFFRQQGGGFLEGPSQPLPTFVTRRPRGNESARHSVTSDRGVRLFLHLTQRARQRASLAQADAKLRSSSLPRILEPTMVCCFNVQSDTRLGAVSCIAFIGLNNFFPLLHTELKGVYV
jgi:hypothetical protein